MIKTKDLIELIGESRETPYPPENARIRKYKDEIIKRLWELDKLKKEIKSGQE